MKEYGNHVLGIRNFRVYSRTSQPHEPCRGLCVYGRREEVSLPQFAAGLAEMIEMLRGFNTFRNHFQFQLVRQKDDQLYCVSRAPVGQDSANERVVDLQGLEGKWHQPV